MIMFSCISVLGAVIPRVRFFFTFCFLVGVSRLKFLFPCCCKCSWFKQLFHNRDGNLEMSNIVVDLVSVLLLSIYNYGLWMQPEAILFHCHSASLLYYVWFFMDREY